MALTETQEPTPVEWEVFEKIGEHEAYILGAFKTEEEAYAFAAFLKSNTREADFFVEISEYDWPYTS